MGAWGAQLNECDGTLDFLGEVGDSRDWSVVENRLRLYVAEGGYEDAEEAWAAAELVSAALGKPSIHLDPALAEWARAHEADARKIKDQAGEAVRLIAEESELSELWAESGDAAEWQGAIADLKARVEA
jgi:hypothetical protein